MLGRQHAEAIASAGGIPVLLDLCLDPVAEVAADLARHFDVPALGLEGNITDEKDIAEIKERVMERFGRVDILINNAANNPKVEDGDSASFSRFETMPLPTWNDDIAVGLTGAFLCSRVFGAEMARAGKGVILNIASDLSVIAPDQRLYQEPGREPSNQPVKPVTYSVVKTGLIGLTRYLATYWAAQGIRSNALSPGGVYNGQPDEFLAKLNNLIPMVRMANVDEYHGVVLYLCSDASSYMTGQNVIIDGGRTVW